MNTNLKPGDVIAEEKYLVKVDGEEFIYTMILEKSGAFSYGNGTCMTLKCSEKGVGDQHFDTRYCDFAPSGDGFHKWSYEWLKNYCRQDCVIERVG